MEYVKCPSCGNETPKVLSRCRHCGKDLSVPVTPTEYGDSQHKDRAGFITFFLWLGMAANALMGTLYFATIFTREGVWSAYDPMSSRIFGTISSITIFFGFLSLIKWKRSGFYIIILMDFVSLIYNLIIGEDLSDALSFCFFSILILCGILQIRKNGKSCWEQLS